ncbi:ABC transporter ATP-binding protein [Spirulina sp. CS-785/01]|uniref:ABC transporter ATP-binding protein n=1 Tax=Spirulina sp. CS-785/01 TaxID=3021716 RepID=UPI00232DAA9F|nr:ABC transporter ATP-binding protein [Spirulina sp. CS-785/01]MDB9315584.1 ABC transporter ATP-binding protein [Spirulina sp. CS-785/01]
MNDCVLQVENLGKCFKIYQNPWDRAREWLNFNKTCYHQPFWSFRNIFFKVKRGHFFGIIGQNGAGKSTLLKIITGILTPTEGTYQLNGKVLSLLELGTDFNFALTGRENAIARSKLLGFPPDYIQTRLPEIIDFSELGDFFDRPVKLYSSGMKARLAFSLFTFLDCDVLILDEVLAVGDIFFHQKCYARLEELIKKKVTIILVTHNLATVRQFCDEILLLHRGQQIFLGDPKQGLVKYHQLRTSPLSLTSPFPTQRKPVEPKGANSTQDFFWPTDDNLIAFECSTFNSAQLLRYGMCDEAGQLSTTFEQGEKIWFCCEFLVKETLAVPLVSMSITNKFNVLVHSKSSYQHQAKVPTCVEGGSLLRFCRQVKLSIGAGDYVLGVFLGVIDEDIYKAIDELPSVEINRHISIRDAYSRVGVFSVRIPYGITEESHWGICNLAGDCQVQVVNVSED